MCIPKVRAFAETLQRGGDGRCGDAGASAQKANVIIHPQTRRREGQVQEEGPREGVSVSPSTTLYLTKTTETEVGTHYGCTVSTWFYCLSDGILHRAYLVKQIFLGSA